jgi:hypothetical protein
MTAGEMDEMMAGPTKAFLAGVKTAGVGAQLLAPTVLEEQQQCDSPNSAPRSRAPRPTFCSLT